MRCSLFVPGCLLGAVIYIDQSVSKFKSKYTSRHEWQRIDSILL